MFTHVSGKGVKMVDVAGKKDVTRIARASGKIKLRGETLEKIKKGRIEKGSVLATAQIAATLAVKKTPELIPMCHPLQITNVSVDFKFGKEEIETIVEVKTIGKTGVEMEALTGAAVALLTIWDMVKAVEKNEKGQYPFTKISEIKVLEKIKKE